MRHRKKYRKLGLTTNQRKALLKGLAISLIEHGTIVTTKARAKELKRYVERIISKVKKEDQSHAQRLVFKKLQNKEAVKKLFNEYKDAFVGRPGGYTRTYLLGNRPGDAAEMAQISLILEGLEVEAPKVKKEEKKVEKKAKAKETKKEEVKEDKQEEVKPEAKEEKDNKEVEASE